MAEIQTPVNAERAQPEDDGRRLQQSPGTPEPVVSIARPRVKRRHEGKPSRRKEQTPELIEKKDLKQKPKPKPRLDPKSGEATTKSKDPAEGETPRMEKAEEVYQIIAQGEGLRRRKVEAKEAKKRDLFARRKALVSDEEIKSILKILGPLYRRRLFVEQLKSRWYLVLLPLLIIITILVVSIVVILPLLSEEVESFEPPEPVHATWKVYELRGYNLMDFASTWDTRHTGIWAKTTLLTKMSPIYDSLSYPITDIVATSLHTDAIEQTRGRATKEALFTLEHDIIFSDKEADHQDVVIDLSKMMKTARRNLLLSDDWRISPFDMVMRQGAATVSSASVRRFLGRPVPPVDLKRTPLPVVAEVTEPEEEAKLCDAIFIPPLTVVQPYSCTFSTTTFAVGTKCYFSCPDGYTLLGSDVRVCLPSGVWDGRNPRCSKPCPPLPPLLNGRIEPVGCTANTSVTEDTRCVPICSELHALSRRVMPVCGKGGEWSAQSPLCKRQCAYLKIPDELVVVPASCASKPVSQGDVCVFSCREDTLLYGETSISCDSDGKWTDEVPVCRTKCPTLERVANTQVHPSTCDKEAMFEGMSCVYSCALGFRLVGPASRGCTKHGNWTGQAPKCVHTCDELEGPANGDVQPITCTTTKVTSGTLCRISCDSGFAPDGSTNLTCAESGVWDASTPRCLANCPALVAPKNSDLACTGHIEESTCALYCLSGYQLRGSGFVMCQADGTWTEALGECEKVCPTLQAPENAEISPLECTVVENTLGFACTVTCDMSYGISGSSRRVCTANGTWSGEAATCNYEKQFLLVLNIKQVAVCAESEGRTVKKVPEDACLPSHSNLWSIHEGHLLKNSKEGLCLAFDALVPMANATLMECNASDPRQSWEWPETTRENYTLKTRKRPLYLWYGYRTSDKMYASGEPNAETKWLLKDPETNAVNSFFGATHDGHCPALENVPNGRWSPTTCGAGVNPTGALCSFLCGQGYEIDSGTSTVTCANGLWQGGTSPKCVAICRALDGLRFNNGSVSPPTCFSSAYLARGATCSFQCDANFVLVGERNIACGANARWSAAQPRCERKCPPFPLPANSRIVPRPSSCPKPTGLSDEGAVCGVGCSDGYILQGSPAVVCLTDGQWNDTSQRCVRTCLHPKTPQHGAVQCDNVGASFPRGTKCIHSCFGGRSLLPRNHANASCLENGVWSVATPACQHLCDPLVPSPNATIAPDDCKGSHALPNGKLCRFACQPDFTLSTPAEAMCLSSGKWSVSTAKCLPSHHFTLLPATGDSCVSVSHYAHHSSHFVVKRPLAQCHAFNATSQWLRTAAGQLEHVETGWCLAVDRARDKEVVKLRDCDTSDPNQRWECGITESAFAVYLKGTDLMLQTKHDLPSVFVGKSTRANGTSHSWLASYNDGVDGSVCGTSFGEGDSCPTVVLTAGSAIAPFTCQGQVNVDSICSVTCDNGYELNSGATLRQIKCQKYGKWSSLDVFCKRRRCKTLHLPPGAVVSNAACRSANMAPWSSVECAVTCDTGFRVLRPGSTGVLRCLGNGMWSEPLPSCVSTCQALTKPDHGYVSPEDRCTTENKEGDMCEFSCLPHYRLAGAGRLECNSGAWSAPQPVCQKIAGTPGECKLRDPPDYGHVVPLQCIMQEIAFNQSCRVICAPGFEPMPRGVAYVCQADGSWSTEMPQCRRVCSSFGVPEHSSIHPQRCTDGVNTEGEQCHIVCDPGYSTTGNRHATCTQSGQWDSALSWCERVAQFLIKASGPEMCLTAANEAHGLVHFAACDFHNAMQKWEWINNRFVRNVGAQMCLTPEMNRSYSSLNLSACDAAVSAEWKCAYAASSVHQEFHYERFLLGYSVASPRIAFVVDPSEDDEAWITKRGIHFYGINETAVGTICSYRNGAICPGLPPIEDGVVEADCDGSSDHIRHGTNCRYSCETGYRLVGQQGRVCQGNGLWDDVTAVQCKRACPAFQPAFNQVTSEACVSASPFEGTECTFQCAEGFLRSGPDSRVCQPDGTWSEEEVICHKNCPARRDSTGHLMSSPDSCLTEEQTSGAVCRFTCPSGYILLVSAVHTCLNDGSWSEESPSCVRSCPALKPVTNGRVLPTNCVGTAKGAGHACVYSCNGARSLDGTKIRSCTGAGVWTGSDPVCRTTCPVLTAPPNGEVRCPREPPLSGDSCTYGCAPNYVVEGPSDNRTCLASGIWSDSDPTCAHEFQFMIFQSTPPGSTLCFFVNKQGAPAAKDDSDCSFESARDRWSWYRENLIRHAATRLCLAGASLDSDAYLKLDDCDVGSELQQWECPDTERSWFFRLTGSQLYPISLPFSTQKILLYSDSSIDFMVSNNGGVTQHTSFYATTVLTNRTYVCSARRENKCRPIRAGDQLVAQPLPCTEAQSPVGTECRFSCLPNYILSSTLAAVRCLKSGRWSGDIPTCLRACPPLKIVDDKNLLVRPATCVGSSGVPEKLSCTSSCPSGFLLEGQATLTCLRSHRWDADVPVCKAICPSLTELRHGVVKPAECIGHESPILEGARCTYTCPQEEHVLSGKAVRTCTSDGKWDVGEPACVKPCPALPPPNGGKVLPGRCAEESSLAETVCAFSCNATLIHIGSEYRVCLANGSWTGKKSVCQTPCPTLVTAEDNFLLEPVACANELVTPGRECRSVCKPGYQLQGTERVTCTPEGTWSDELGECLRRCPKLTRLQNGQVLPPSCLGGDLFEGQQCEFSCQPQHILVGSDIRRCNDNGTWTGEDSRCVKSCEPLGLFENVVFEPVSCQSDPQPMGTSCLVYCAPGTSTPLGNSSVTLKCKENGEWDVKPISQCLEKCEEPIVQNGVVACRTALGHRTKSVVLGTRCDVECDEDHVPMTYTTSACVKLEDNATSWSPAIAQCAYEPDPMVIINRIGFTTYCFGEKDYRVILVEWEQCSEHESRARWVWQGPHLIRNAYSGRCLAAAEAKALAFVITSLCNESEALQQWDCDRDQPYSLRMLGHELRLDTSREKSDGVVLRREATEAGLLYTYNPETETETGTLCSRREDGQCTAMYLPEGTHPLEVGCDEKKADVGDVCQVRCLHSQDEPIDVKCTSSGIRKPDLKVVCAPSCRTPPLPQGIARYEEGACAETKLDIGARCTLTCPDGYTIVGDDRFTTCLADMRWEPINDYDCIKTCPPIETPDNGRQNVPRCVHGTCTLKCDPHYRVEGPQSRTCQASGEWSGVPYSCAPEVQFKVISANRFLNTYACLTIDTGVVIKSACLKAHLPQLWRWSSRHTLQSVDNDKCLALNRSPKTLSTTQTGRSAGVSNRSAIATGVKIEQNKNAPLVIADCNATDETQRWGCASEPHALQQPYLVLIAQQLYLDAGPVYNTDVDVKPVATKSSEWIGGHYTGKRGLCGFRRTGVCPPLEEPYDGAVEPDLCRGEYIADGARCKFSCDEGFAMRGETVIICKRSGEWSSEPPICIGIENCRALVPIGPMRITPPDCTKAEVQDGTVCKIKCPDSMVLNGAARTLCKIDGTWSEPLPTCDPQCPAIQPPSDGFISPAVCEHDHRPVGSVCDASCSPGYTLVGTAQRSCLADGQWSGERADCLRFCAPLGELIDGNIAPRTCEVNASAPRQICLFSCSFGSFLVGPESVECTEGNWTSPKPICSGDWCPRPKIDLSTTEELTYDKLVNGAVGPGSTLTVACLKGLDLIGPEVRVCQSDSTWSYANVSCLNARCKPLLRLYHRKLSSQVCHSKDGVMANTICQFTCDDSYLLVGPKSTECQYGGRWSPANDPQCVDTLGTARSVSFSVVLHYTGSPNRCLTAAKTEKYVHLVNCDGSDAFQQWKWYGSGRLQNVARQQCLTLSPHRKVVVEQCDLQKTAQSTGCANSVIGSTKYKITLGTYGIDDSLYGQHSVSAGRWVWFGVFASKHPAWLNTNQRVDVSKLEPICSFMCGGEIAGNEGDFSSPNYPRSYPSDVSCTWGVRSKKGKRVLHLHFSELHLKNPTTKPKFRDSASGAAANADDYLAVYEGEASNGNVLIRTHTDSPKFSVSTIYGKVTVAFHSDHRRNENAGGFSVHWFTSPWPKFRRGCALYGQRLIATEKPNPLRSQWQAMVLYRQYFACNAFMVTDRAFVTSARCIEHYSHYDELFQFGHYQVVLKLASQDQLMRKKEQGSFIPVSKIVLHPGFSRETLSDDAALVFVEENIASSPTRAPICVPNLEAGRIAGPQVKTCWALQWLEDMLFASAPSKQWEWTRFMAVTILDDRDCLAYVPHSDTLGEFLCAKERRPSRWERVPDAPSGLSFKPDTEGVLLQCPFNVNWYAVGLSSVALLEERKVYIFTNLERLSSWIDRNTRHVPDVK